MTDKDMKFLAHKLGTMLLKIKVLKMLETNYTKDPNEILFRDDVMYQWSCKSESIESSPVKKSNGWKLPSSSSTIASMEPGGEDELVSSNKPGAKYTEAEYQQALMKLKRE